MNLLEYFGSGVLVVIAVIFVLILIGIFRKD